MPVKDPLEMAGLVLEAQKLAQRIGRYDVWTCSSGAQLWIRPTPEGKVLGFTPHFSGNARVPLTLQGNAAGEEELIFASGGLSDCADFPLLFHSPEFHNLSLEGGAQRRVQLCAFAGDYSLADSLEERERKGHFVASYGKALCVPVGIVDEEQRPAEHPEPRALFSGAVVEHRVLRNSLTDQEFLWLRLAMANGEVDVVAGKPGELPRPGQLLTCPAYVTGRVVA